MKFSPESLHFVVAATCFFHEAEASSWRPELPWDELKSKLASSASLVDTSPSAFIEECVPEFLDKPDPMSRTNHFLIEPPSGLCVSQLFCAFEGCYPRPHGSNLSLTERLGELVPSLPEQYVIDWVKDPTNPSYNLPSKVLFPTDASEVIAAVKFAKEHRLEISVKNSGHSIQGASTKRDTLHINMMRFKQYVTESITDCDIPSLLNGRASSDFDDQPCQLAAAREKPAFIRVGGGENWDKTYRAVKAANEEQEGGYKYHIVGGGAGTVSPSKSIQCVYMYCLQIQ